MSILIDGIEMPDEKFVSGFYIDGNNGNVLDISRKNVIGHAIDICRCKDCKYRIVNENYGKNGYFKGLKAICELDTGDPFELGRNAEDDEWFCADAERRD